MLEPDTITVELHDGRSFMYRSSAQTPEEIVTDLIAKGVTKKDIKCTIHVVPRLPHSMAYRME
jgi:hypothetical protein